MLKRIAGRECFVPSREKGSRKGINTFENPPFPARARARARVCVCVCVLVVELVLCTHAQRCASAQQANLFGRASIHSGCFSSRGNCKKQVETDFTLVLFFFRFQEPTLPQPSCILESFVEWVPNLNQSNNREGAAFVPTWVFGQVSKS